MDMNEYSISLGEVEEKIDELPETFDPDQKGYSPVPYDWDEKYKLYKAIDILKEFLWELEKPQEPVKKGKPKRRRRQKLKEAITQTGVGVKCRLCNREFQSGHALLHIMPSEEAVHVYCYTQLYRTQTVFGDVKK